MIIEIEIANKSCSMFPFLLPLFSSIICLIEIGLSSYCFIEQKQDIICFRPSP